MRSRAADWIAWLARPEAGEKPSHTVRFTLRAWGRNLLSAGLYEDRHGHVVCIWIGRSDNAVTVRL